MSVQQLKQSTGLTTSAPNGGAIKPLTFPEMLEKHKQQLALALPKHLNADRMARIALTEFRKNPELGECDPKSIFAAIIVLSQLGLEPGVMGQAYLVPYNDRKKGVKICQAVPGWQGYVDLVSRSGRASVWTGVVHEGDRFTYRLGSRPEIEHVPDPDSTDEANFTFVYAIGWVKDAQWPIIEIQSHAKIANHLNRYNKIGDRHYAKQNATNFEMYGRKVALLQVIKYMPKSVELQTAAGLDYSTDAGTQTISVHEAIAGTFQPSGYPVEEATIETQVEAVSTPVEPTRQEQIFDCLAWNDDVRKKWLKANSKLSEAEQIAKLEAELDKE